MLKGRVILVTGASRGIGAATARHLAADGAAVAVNYRENEAAARQVVEDIRAKGGLAMAVRTDVRDETEVAAMVREIGHKLGPVDTLVSNAAIAFPTKPFTEYRWEEFAAKLDGEIKSAFLLVQAVLPGMRERRKGCIVAISSTLSRRPGEGFSAHTCAKSGLDGLMRALALELGPLGIRVNVVAPGLTETDATAHVPERAKEGTARSTPLGRIAQPEDIAGAVLMLVSDATGFVTGTYVPVNGGAYMP